MGSLGLILLVLAMLLAGIAACLTVTVRGIHLGWLAVAVYLLSLILGGAHL